MRDDTELLRRYVEFHTEADFTELVRRHLGFVYHAALRRTGGRAALAEEISQQVFTMLARRASSLCDHPVLVGWLHTTTRHAASTVLRSERRRIAREQEAHRMNKLDDTVPAEWPRMREELDRMLDELSERDREAILLRFFHDRPFAQIGAMLSLNEDAARKRVDRALEKLRELLAKRGVTSTSAALATLLAGQSVLAAPAELTPTIAHAALMNAAAGGASATVMTLMGTKITAGVAGLIGVASLLIIPTVGIAVYEHNEAEKAAATLASAQLEFTAARTRLELAKKSIAEVDQQAAQTQAKLEQARAAAAMARTATPTATAAGKPAVNPATDKARADAEKFFAQYSQVRAMIMELGYAQIRRGHAGFYRFASLTPDQITRFETELANQCLATAMMTPTSLVPGSAQLPEEKMRAIFGDDGFLRYQEYNKIRPAYELTTQVATAVGYGATPLSEAQADQLVQTVLSHTPSYQPGSRLDLDGTDWNSTIADMKASLTPAQWHAAEPLVLSVAFKRSVNQAHQKTVAANEPAKP